MNRFLARIAVLLGAILLSSVPAVAQQPLVVPPPAPATPPDTSASGERAAEKREERTRRPSRDRIEAEEINANAAASADVYSLINSSRPSWLRVRRTSINLVEEVRVYRDGVPLGGPAALRQIPTSSVIRIEHLDGIRATTRFGTGHGSGAIMVFTRS